MKNFNEIFNERYLLFLRSVFLDGNRIKVNNAVPFFTKTPYLKKISLNRNPISSLYSETFSTLKHLVTLELKNCGIETIKNSSFDANKNLQRLNLRGNLLQFLPDGLFSKLKNLVYIGFHHNKLTDLPDLKGLPKQMEKIRFSNNRIKSIDGLISSGIESIASLELSDNKISAFSARIFQKIFVRSLYISGNGLLEIKPMSFNGWKDQVRYFFVFSSNNLSFLDGRAFLGIKEIAVLALFKNKITSTSPHPFRNINIHQILLHQNNLQSLDGLLTGLVQAPKLVTLFENPITQIKDFGTKHRDFQVHLTCKNLHSVKLNKNYPHLKCSPSVKFKMVFTNDIILADVTNSMGFKCTLEHRKYAVVTVCSPCDLGFYKLPGDSFSNCLPCPFGMFYQDELAQLYCKQCPPGQYIHPGGPPGRDKLDCQTCPEGTLLDKPAGYRACRCLPGFARIDRFGPCTECKEKGVVCNEYKTLKHGYWWQWRPNLLQNFKSFAENLEIRNDTYNRSTNKFNDYYPQIHKCHLKGICKGGVVAKCKNGYKGPVCATCDSGYFRKVQACSKCPPELVSILLFITGFSLFIIFIFLLSWSDSIYLRFDIINSEHEQRRSLSSVILSLFKILMSFIQTIIVLTKILPETSFLTNTLATVFVPYVQIFPVEILACFDSDWNTNSIQLLSISFWLLLATTLAAILTVALLKFFARFCCNTCIKTILHKRAKQLMRATCIFLYLQIPCLTFKIMYYLPSHCNVLCLLKDKRGRCINSITHMITDYSVNCNTELSSYSYYLLYIGICIPVAYTIFLIIVLKKLRHVERLVSINQSVNNLETNDAREIAEFAIGFCLENYHAKFWWWEILQFNYRAVLLPLVTYIGDWPMTCYSTALIIIWLYAIIYAYNLPICYTFENILQELILFLICLYIYMAFFMRKNSVQIIAVWSSTFVIASSSAILGAVIIWVISRARRN